ncbi:Threonine/homoserine/homoserine lactone efflux protein [Actinopolyspora mzabensis]|uniref:Threonine/homoserine/homoserine lactone efflux protein n=1 Tax=Actinopolyspora mzabensis TaxID=995066 RepID=A0A1G9DMF7_ACTMZ|nr:LysE family translocator [Actinopolyspora mzabensis]SDK65044.1 Threonine/homoserine/homoserine lactone efflux protein [Actinopolyspora mzabensis]
MPDQLLPFLVLAVLITVAPGPDITLGLRNSLRGGATAMWWTGLGCCSGLGVHATASVIGLSTVLATSATAYATLRTAGAGYLLWLGFQSLLGAVRANRTLATPSDSGVTAAPDTLGRSAAYRQGLLSNLLNPKIAVLFLTLLPQFVGPNEPHARTSLQLALAFIAVGLLWWRLTSWLFGGIQGVLRRRWFRTALESTTGLVLIALGLRVAFTIWRDGIP